MGSEGAPDVVTLLSEKLSFWFSASNLRKDNFLIAQIRGNEGGWVPVSDILSFNSVKQLNVSRGHVLTAAREVSCIEVDDATDGGRLRLAGGGRAVLESILSDEAKLTEDTRTLFLRPLPVDVTQGRVLDAVDAVGDCSRAQVLYVSLPRKPCGSGRGFGFVEFDSVANAARFRAAVNGQSVMALRRDFPRLSATPRSEWKARKERAKTGATKGPPRRFMRDRGEECEASTRHNAASVAQERGDSTRQEPKPPPVFQPDVLVRASGYKLPTTRGELRDLFEDYGPVEYVDYSEKSPETCTVRYLHRSGAHRLISQGGPFATGELIQGDEERACWEQISQQSGTKRRRQQDSRRQTAEAANIVSARPIGTERRRLRIAGSGTAKPVHMRFDEDDDDSD